MIRETTKTIIRSKIGSLLTEDVIEISRSTVAKSVNLLSIPTSLKRKRFEALIFLPLY